MATLLLLATVIAAASVAAYVAMGRREPAVHNSLKSDAALASLTSDIEQADKQTSTWFDALIPAGAVAVGVLTLALLAGRPDPPPASERNARAAQALELLALDVERNGTALTVHGVVRNPSRASGVPNLTAVVLLFNQQGAFLTSARAVVDTEALGPGRQSQFVVTIPGADGAGTYRVSFRSDDHLLRHVDRRAS